MGQKQLADEREKTQKEEIRKRSEFQKLKTDINELIISNKDLKAEIVNLRKRKGEILKKKKEMEEEMINDEYNEYNDDAEIKEGDEEGEGEAEAEGVEIEENIDG